MNACGPTARSPLDNLGDILINFFRNSSVRFGTLIIFLTALCLLHLQADLDLYARLAVGRLINNLGTVPATDPFGFTTRNPVWIDHEWLSGLIFYRILQASGEGGIFMTKIFFMLATSLLLAQARRLYMGDSEHELFFLALLNISMLGLWGGPTRALVFTYLGVAFVLFALTSLDRQSARTSIAIVPVYMTVWANSHGGFVVGLGLLAFAFVFFPCRNKNERWILGAALLASIAATCLNPYGPVEYWKFILSAVFKHRPEIDEWAGISFFSRESAWAMIWICAIVAGIALLGRIVSWAELIVVTIAMVLGFRSYRMVAFFYLIAFVYTAPYFEAVLSHLRKRWPRTWILGVRSAAMTCLIFTAVLLIFVGNFVVRLPSFSLRKAGYPVAALDWLSENRQGGNLLLDFNTGSYAMWRLFPRFRVALDGRYEEVYPDETVRQVAEALDRTQPAHRAALAAIAPDFILSEKTFAPQTAVFGPLFREIYSDPDYSLFEKVS